MFIETKDLEGYLHYVNLAEIVCIEENKFKSNTMVIYFVNDRTLTIKKFDFYIISQHIKKYNASFKGA